MTPDPQLLTISPYTLPQGAARFVAGARSVLDEADLPLELADELRRVLDEIEALKQTIRELTTRIEGLGTTLGRHFASYLGLTPRESSSGLRRRLGRISKRGNTYLRMLLIHGARAALLAAHRADRPDTLQQWALGVETRTGHNKAAVALANRLARIAWRVWRDQRPYERRFTHEASAHGGHPLT